MTKKSSGKIRTRVGIIGELFAYLWKRRLWWLMPMIVVLIFVVGLLIFAQGSPLAPFIYSLF